MPKTVGMRSKTAVIADGTVVHVHYTLSDDRGELIFSSRGGSPVGYLHGAGNIVPGLERQLGGRRVGESFVAIVTPEDGFGFPQGPGPQRLPRTNLPPGIEVDEGMTLVGEGADGQRLALWVTRVEAEHIYVDTDHPLAGRTLHFEIEVASVRKATPEELVRGHVHRHSAWLH